MCGCVAGVAGAALEAVMVLLLAVADAVHAVGLHRGELHALDVHLCAGEKVQSWRGNKSAEREQFITDRLWARLLGSTLRVRIKPRFRWPLTQYKQADLCAPTANPLIDKQLHVCLPHAGLVYTMQPSQLSIFSEVNNTLWAI